MSLNSHARYWHVQYERAPEAVRGAIDEAYEAARASLESHGFSLANDDRAEAFVGAIAEYLAMSVMPGMPGSEVPPGSKSNV